MKKIIILAALIIGSVSCTKDSDEEKFCWDCSDMAGNLLNTYCDKTESDMKNITGPGKPCHAYSKH